MKAAMHSAMKRTVPTLLVLLFAHSTHTLRAQTKIFKEVGEDISTQIRPITQDNALVGYLAFTRLKQADADSFNYRVTVIDENLHDIGAINFRQENLLLDAVAFEQNAKDLSATNNFPLRDGLFLCPLPGSVHARPGQSQQGHECQLQLLVQ